MIIIGDDVDRIMKLKLQLARQFEMKDLDTLRYFLGIEVAYSCKGYLLSQSKYIANILDSTHLFDTPCFSHSSIEAKYHAMAFSTIEIVWLAT
uniref:Reverse transcriptase Ty1/copia-type domain-containing protein n=1 Tax=Cajanus cajan TaxID=3821 RepID=A0A151SCR6_CAJCA|nr:hypothetical protein KK1_025527 [Cajanus cajan]